MKTPHKPQKQPKKQVKAESKPTVLSQNIERIAHEKRIKIPTIMNALGVTRQAVYNYFTGRNKPKDEHLEKLAQLYGMTVSELYADKETATVAIKTVAAFDDYTESLKERIKDLLKNIDDLRKSLDDCRNNKA